MAERSGGLAAPARPRRRPASIRACATAGAAAVIAVALVVGAVAFVWVLRSSLVDGVRTTAEQTLDTLATRIEADGPSVVADQDDDLLVQVVADGRVLAHGDDADGPTLLTTDRSRYRHDGESWLLSADDVDLPGGGEATLVVGASLADADAATAEVSVLLAVAVPVAVLLMAGVTWVVVGRALRPVDRMRREVDSIAAATLNARVAEPGSGDEVDRLAATMNRMLGRLERSQEVQRRFVADASHELRSPLATIRQHAELARAHPEVTDTDELAGVVLDEGARLEDLVTSLLLLTRMDERGVERDTAVDLDDVVLAEAARLRGLGVTVDAGSVGAARASGDPVLLGRVVRNLVDNAARHARSRVVLGLAVDVREVVLTVDDDGTGVPVEQRGRVFERFVRLDEGRARDAGGSGLGLAIVHDVVRAHRGSVAVSDAPGGGARFVVRLPASD
ncbi:HAMP domain-containing sensor histidine kinase [Curtobacterium sp. 1P10AnD]|uniref:sensor histidine kinase n=1 Tax=Curtobacterium sp. 1P10AnD TaxID=3132283 RepID=UPI0039A2E9D1